MEQIPLVAAVSHLASLGATGDALRCAAQALETNDQLWSEQVVVSTTGAVVPWRQWQMTGDGGGWLLDLPRIHSNATAIVAARLDAFIA